MNSVILWSQSNNTPQHGLNDAVIELYPLKILLSKFKVWIRNKLIFHITFTQPLDAMSTRILCGDIDKDIYKCSLPTWWIHRKGWYESPHKQRKKMNGVIPSPEYILSHFKYNIFYSEEKEIKIKSLKITRLWRHSAPLNLFWEVFMNDKQ